MELLVLLLALFVLSLFLGVELITKVPPTLHTPLMSGCNAISGITVVGALLAAGAGEQVTPLGECAWVYRPGVRDRQRGGWFYGDQPHAGHV